MPLCCHLCGGIHFETGVHYLPRKYRYRDEDTSSWKGCTHVPQVWIIGAALWIQLFAALSSCLLTSPQLRAAAAVAEVFAPAAAALVWITVPTHSNSKAVKCLTSCVISNGHRVVSAAADGASAAVAHYNIAAGIGLSLWALTLIELANQAETLLPTLARWMLHPPLSQGSAANAILFIDGAGLWVALLGFAAAEDGFAVAAQVAAGSLLAGPGAAIALYLGNIRERRIGRAVTSALRKSE